MIRVLFPPLCGVALLTLACSGAPETSPAAKTTTVPAVAGEAPSATATATPDQAMAVSPATPAVPALAPAPEPAVPAPPDPPSPPPPPPPIPSTGADLPLSTLPQTDASQLPRVRTPEELLRAEVASWRKVPYKDNGTSRRGISNAAFVRAVSRNALEITVPANYDQQLRTGKLVAREDLAPGDLVFFEGKGVGPFRSHWVGIFVGRNEVALAEKEDGVIVASLARATWGDRFKTARRIPSESSKTAPIFDAASYGSTAELLREVATAWSGTLYKQGGTTFEGIGNDEFIRNIYEAIYDAELEGEPKQWAAMGKAVKQAQLEAGDIILYEAGGVGQFVNQRHAGMYIGDGDFVHAVRGSAVTISKLKDPRWRKAYIAARRIDPDELTRAAERRTGAPPSISPASPAVESPAGRAAATARPTATASVRTMSEVEQRLREATEPWKGTPYRLGGTSKSGIDCSALVRALYKDVFEVELPRTSMEQERLGTKVDRRALAPGDLVFFRTQGMGPFFKSRHVGVYLGNGEFAQASGRLGVNVARLDNYYWNRKYSGAKRIAVQK